MHVTYSAVLSYPLHGIPDDRKAAQDWCIIRYIILLTLFRAQCKDATRCLLRVKNESRINICYGFHAPCRQSSGRTCRYYRSWYILPLKDVSDLTSVFWIWCSTYLIGCGGYHSYDGKTKWRSQIRQSKTSIVTEHPIDQMSVLLREGTSMATPLSDIFFIY